MSSDLTSKPLACPHCREPIVEGEESWYFRGDGPPPSYAVRCDSCGAQGPYGNGKFRGDHAGAQIEAIRLWNDRTTEPPAAPPVAWRKLVEDPYELRARYLFREDTGIGAPEGWEPLYALSPTKPACQHDLLKPATTIDVIDDWSARCTVCFQDYRLGRPVTAGETSAAP